MGLDFLDYNEKGETLLNSDDRKGLKVPAGTHEDVNIYEKGNITKGCSWLKTTKVSDPWSIAFSQNLHSKLLGDVWDWAGKFRTSDTNLGIDWKQISVSLKNFFNDLEAWEEYGSYPPREILARFHHRTVSIHPFPNGNGRWSRIYTSHYDSKVHKIKIDWTGGFEDPEESRKEYLEAIRAGDERDLSLLIKYMFPE
jgi:Fic-DOC domain mobile mystery protein B